MPMPRRRAWWKGSPVYYDPPYMTDAELHSELRALRETELFAAAPTTGPARAYRARLDSDIVAISHELERRGFDPDVIE